MSPLAEYNSCPYISVPSLPGSTKNHCVRALELKKTKKQ
eukprot:CAMPEP_0182831820 /NCGR_PEP_ID=MMETSP0006_2-20121128/19353_1 /TAXON_ID=97485 /ORGANISM="Prymnesium parvum, Strain Texoma1" /LENGTH=38 /DNA_ID= /DNA_START= /DNA_END= /DNA_ORIENTATION=